jgi:UPF0755 protein
MKMRWLKYIAACTALLVLVWGSITAFNLYRLYSQPMTPAESFSSVVRLDKAMTATSLAHVLKSQNLIQSERLFLALVRAEKLSQRLKAGIYQVKPGETCLQFLRRVVSGDVMIESFQIIEGSNLQQVSANLAKAPWLTCQDTDWSAVSEQKVSAEGLLLADTYRYNAGSRARDLILRAHANLQRYLDGSWQNRAPDLPYKSAYDMLIAASIVEKEANVPAEKRLIAGVIINRLNKHMPLQMDPTVIYALGTAYHGKLTHEDMQIDSPYNSYRYRGLPPTPIAMVGKDAIDAAAHPQRTDYLYFVARGDGTHQFSVTYDQQKEAIARYLGKKI